jgi:hypothetical protein
LYVIAQREGTETGERWNREWTNKNNVEINTELYSTGASLDFLPQPKTVIGNKYWEGDDGTVEPVRARYGAPLSIRYVGMSLMTSRL